MRILIVDDHPITRAGLREALEPEADVEILGEASTGEEAVTAVQQLRPNLVFMDVRMPGMGGLEAARIIRREFPSTRVIVFTVDESRASMAEAIRAGVSGYLLKDVGVDELLAAARLVMTGKQVIHPSITREFVEELSRSERGSHPLLSGREVEILQRVAYGSTTREVADQLGISRYTVKTHLDRIFEKLGANDRAQAVAIALRQGMVE